MNVRVGSNVFSPKQLPLKALVDALGSAKAVTADAKKQEDAFKEELLRRLKSRATLDTTVVREGTLYRATISYSEPVRVDVEKLRDKLGDKFLKKYEYTGSQYNVRVVSKTGKKDT